MKRVKFADDLPEVGDVVRIIIPDDNDRIDCTVFETVVKSRRVSLPLNSDVDDRDFYEATEGVFKLEDGSPFQEDDHLTIVYSSHWRHWFISGDARDIVVEIIHRRNR